jgi:selenocysteine lyase/cysteine desulfurase
VALIDYFGFDRARSWATAANARGAWVLEDASQALLSHGVGSSADFVVFRPRKFLGVPDGGILRLNAPLPLEGEVLKPPPPES